MSLRMLALIFVALSWSASRAAEPPADNPALVPPFPIWPADQETIADRHPTFRLSGRPNALYYRIELARNETFTNSLILKGAQVTPGAIAPDVRIAHRGEPLAPGRYCWRAFCGSGGYETPPANHRVFFIAEHPPRELSLPSGAARPLLLPVDAQLRRMFERIADQSAKGLLYQLNAAATLLDLAPPSETYARSGPGQHAYYAVAAGWYARYLGTIGFAWQATRNDRYAEKGIEMLMTAVRYARWLGPDFDDRTKFDPPWRAALETATMTRAVARGYDLLHARLSREQRGEVRDALVEKGIRPLIDEWVDPISAAGWPRHQAPTGNWVMVCSAAAGLGALAILDEHPDAPRWARLAADRVRAWFHDRGGDYFVDNPWPAGRANPAPAIGPSEPNFDREGAYKESLGYMNYAMNHVCAFADAYRRLGGENLFDHVPKNILDQLAWNVTAWPTQAGVRVSVTEFGDSSGHAVLFEDVLSALVRHREDRLANWLQNRIMPVPQSLESLMWRSEMEMEQAPDAANPIQVFADLGQVVMRGGWSPRSPVAAIKFHQNRGHLDLGTFCLLGAGGPLLVDSGTTPYVSDIYRNYSSQSIAHNVVLVDDLPQRRSDGRLTAASATGAMSFASGELAAAYPDLLESWTRDLLMLPGGRALIVDTLQGRGARQYDLILHPASPFRIGGENAFIIGETRVTVSGASPCAISEADGYIGATPRKYARFRSRGATADQRFVTFVERNDDRTASVMPSPASRPASRYDFADPDGTLHVRIGDWDDDALACRARVAAVWRPGRRDAVWHALLIGATRLALNGRDVFIADEPINAAIEVEHDFQIRLANPSSARISVSAGPDLRNVFLDGKPAAATLAEGVTSMNVPAGSHTLVLTDAGRPPPRIGSLRQDDLLAVPVRDAPAHRIGVAFRCSSCWTPPTDAFDGHADTFWSPLPESLPQWIEVELPAPETINRIYVLTGGPCSGRILLWDTPTGPESATCGFEAHSDTDEIEVAVRPMRLMKARIIIEEVSVGAGGAAIHSVRWADVKEQTESSPRNAGNR